LFRQFSLPLAFAAVFPNTLHAQEDSFSHCSSNGKSAVVFHTGNSNQTTQPYITFQITSGNTDAKPIEVNGFSAFDYDIAVGSASDFCALSPRQIPAISNLYSDDLSSSFGRSCHNPNTGKSAQLHFNGSVLSYQEFHQSLPLENLESINRQVQEPQADYQIPISPYKDMDLIITRWTNKMQNFCME